MTKKLESTANLIVVDLLSEGEIAGLVDQNGDLVSGRNRPGRKGYVDSSGLLQGAYDKSSGPILDETNSSANPFRYKGIFLNDTPVITTPKGPASLGREQVNFRRFYSEIRFGHQEQEPFNLLGSQNTISKGENLIGPLASSFDRQDQLSESSNSVYHTITNINVTEVIVTVNIPQLYKVESVHEETLGDMKDSEIEFFIEYGIEGEPLRNYRGDHVPDAYSLGSSPIKIKGIATSPYFVDFLIRIGDLNYDSGIAGKSIQGLENPYKKNRVIKLTRATREKDPEEEATEGDDTADHNRSIRWQAVVEVVPENFNYGNSVVVASQFDARYFDRIPERSFNCKLMKIPVPSNYDPESRRYKGHWDGTFSTEKYLWENGQTGKYWTNNPAWIFYDIMTNRRYGVAKFLDPDFDPSAQVDKWNLYEISKICDEIVLTGTSPRYGWSELQTFKNKLKAGSNNYIELNVVENSDDADLVKKFGNSNEGGSPNMLDYAGQEIVIKTCDNNIYKRKIVSSSHERTAKSGGWQHVFKLTIDGGILENEFENEEVCAEAGVKFTGDYEVAEPRFACNVVIQDKQEAVQVLNELASVFRGMLYYANGMTFLTTDVKREPVTLFTNANTKEGNFSYSGSSKTSRKSVVLVRYNDVFDGYRPKIEYVEDADAINKFGYQEDEVIAFGCTSRGQARRLGEWVLLTNQLEREAINFSTGLEASFLKPGDIFKVIDKNRTIKRFGGRVKDVESDGASIAEITLDSKIQDKLSHKKITIITPKKNENVETLNAKAASSGGISIEEIANSHEAQITTFEFDPASDLSEIIEINKDKVKLNPNAKITRMTMGEMQHGRFPEWNSSSKYLTGMKVKYKSLYWVATEANDASIPFDGAGSSWERYQAFDIHSILLEIPVGSIWIMESEDADISVQSYLYRTLRVSEKAIGEFEINGLEYVPNKFDVIEKGAKLEKVKPLPAYSYYGSLPNASLGIEIGNS